MKAHQSHWNLSFIVASGLVIVGLIVVLRGPWKSQPEPGIETVEELVAKPPVTGEEQGLSPETSSSKVSVVHPELAVLIGEMPKSNGVSTPSASRPNYNRRIVALNAIQSKDLDLATRTAILDYLRRPTGQPRNCRPDLVEASIKNDLIEWLQERRPLLPELTETLITIATDPAQPVVMQDYALQHMGSWGRTLSASSVDWKSEALDGLLTSLWDATEQNEHSFAGTALLSLRRVGVTENDQLLAQSLRVVQEKQFSPLSRATALQILGGLDSERALAIARESSIGEGLPVLRLAAIAVLGTYDDSVEALEQDVIKEDPRYAVAVGRAREQISKRIQENGGEG